MRSCHIAHLLFVFTFDHDPDQGPVPDLRNSTRPRPASSAPLPPLPAERHRRSWILAFGEAHIDQHLRNLLMPERNLASGISALRMAVSTCRAATIPSPVVV